MILFHYSSLSLGEFSPHWLGPQHLHGYLFHSLVTPVFISHFPISNSTILLKTNMHLKHFISSYHLPCFHTPHTLGTAIPSYNLLFISSLYDLHSNNLPIAPITFTASFTPTFTLVFILPLLYTRHTYSSSSAFNIQQYTHPSPLLRLIAFLFTTFTLGH